MSELKGYASQDPLKSDSDIASYNNEFKDLQVQLYQISQMDFNGASLFALYRTDPTNPGETDDAEAIFGADKQHTLYDHTFDIYTSSEGSEGTKVSIHKALLLSALTLRQDRSVTNGRVLNAGETSAVLNDNNVVSTDNPETNINGTWSRANSSDSATGTGNFNQHPSGYTLASYNDTTPANTVNNEYLTLAVTDTSKALDLSQVSAGVFEKAIENVVYLRAQSGGGMTRLNFALDSIASQETNMRSALGRIEDVDIAAESANLARYSILMQASAAMAVQANIQNEVALMLLR
jgi:flagellin